MATGINWQEVVAQLKDQSWREDEESGLFYREVRLNAPASPGYELIELEASLIGLHVYNAECVPDYVGVENPELVIYAGEIREAKSYSYAVNIGPDDHYFYARDFEDREEAISEATNLAVFFNVPIAIQMTATLDDGTKIDI